MKPKYTERLKEGLAIGATALALNGCDVSAEAKKVQVEVDTRMKLNECIRKAHPERGINTELIWSDVSDMPIFWRLKRFGFDPRVIQCDPDQLIVNLTDCGTIMLKKDTFLCGDEKADGTWERVAPASSGPDLLTPADQTKDPAKWKTYQGVCNTVFNQCLDQAK